MADETYKIDPAIREKYRIEREKRLRNEGNDQYQSMTGRFAHYNEDPYADPEFSREAMEKEVEVVIVGAGFGGLVAGVNLQNEGIDDILLIDKAAGVGGVWYWNRYPGVQCDTESYVYLPLLEKTGYLPKNKYSEGQEIREYAELIANNTGLQERTLFQTSVTGMIWQEDTKRWLIETDREDSLFARYVINANGQLNSPKLPGIRGIEKYRGHCFHSSRWDYAYTGGGQWGGLARLADKAVAVIGTACSGIQLIPHVAESAKRLYVFQRTPSAVDTRANLPTDTDWIKGLKPGWQKERIENFTLLATGGTAEEDLVQDGWTEMSKEIGAFAALPGSDGHFDATAAEAADYARMERLRSRVDEFVEDRHTADALKAYYKFYCKRPTFSDEYYQSFNRDNVTLVDTNGLGVTEVNEQGIVFDGVVYPVDCIIFASGYEVGTLHTERAGYDPIGRNGLKLSEKWSEGLRTFRGMQTHAFPNWFLSGLTQSAISPNFLHLITEQMNHIAYIIGEAKRRGLNSVEPSEEVENAWCEEMDRRDFNYDYLVDCTPSYMNNEGKIEERTSHSITGSIYGGGAIEFIRMLEAWREEGSFRGVLAD